MAKPPKRKRSFGDVGLPVSPKYIYPTARRKMILAGAAAAAVLVLFVLLDVNMGNAGFICSGPLSYNHARLQDDCSQCHDPFGSVSAGKCTSCHERFDAEIYTLEAHYAYRSDDSSRLGTAHSTLVCADCHVEHLGRQAELTEVSDERCLACHAFGQFPGDHPEFDAVLADDRTSLNFTHIDHITEYGVMDELPEGASLEAACLYCHRPDRQGKGFEPLDFETTCASCHLELGTKTPYVQILSASRAGVETAESLKRSLNGERWVGLSAGSDMFERKGDTLRKRELDHADAWILENLERFHDTKTILLALSRLVTASAAGEPFDAQRELYVTLIEELDKLARRTSLQSERQWAQGRVLQLQEVLRRQAALSEPDLRRALKMADWRPARQMKAELETTARLAEDLSRPCRECHQLDEMQIAAVDANQHTLRRAEFDHGAHVLVLSCLECHAAIPVREAYDGQQDVDRSSDKAETQNLPGIENCKSCHSASSGSHACATCHYFHPNKERASGLLAFRDVAE